MKYNTKVNQPSLFSTLQDQELNASKERCESKNNLNPSNTGDKNERVIPTKVSKTDFLPNSSIQMNDGKFSSFAKYSHDDDIYTYTKDEFYTKLSSGVQPNWQFDSENLHLNSSRTSVTNSIEEFLKGGSSEATENNDKETENLGHAHKVDKNYITVEEEILVDLDEASGVETPKFCTHRSLSFRELNELEEYQNTYSSKIIRYLKALIKLLIAKKSFGIVDTKANDELLEEIDYYKNFADRLKTETISENTPLNYNYDSFSKELAEENRGKNDEENLIEFNEINSKLASSDNKHIITRLPVNMNTLPSPINSLGQVEGDISPNYCSRGYKRTESSNAYFPQNVSNLGVTKDQNILNIPYDGSEYYQRLYQFGNNYKNLYYPPQMNHMVYPNPYSGMPLPHFSQMISHHYNNTSDYNGYYYPSYSTMHFSNLDTPLLNSNNNNNNYISSGFYPN